jgi:hypothetical protein
MAPGSYDQETLHTMDYLELPRSMLN